MSQRIDRCELVKNNPETDWLLEIIDTERHHNHPIVLVNGVLRWEENGGVRHMVEEIGLNKIIQLLNHMDIGKNSEFYRKLYRDIGISLFGYWEVFYWNWNNEECDDYKPNKKILE